MGLYIKNFMLNLVNKKLLECHMTLTCINYCSLFFTYFYYVFLRLKLESTNLKNRINHNYKRFQGFLFRIYFSSTICLKHWKSVRFCQLKLLNFHKNLHIDLSTKLLNLTWTRNFCMLFIVLMICSKDTC